MGHFCSGLDGQKLAPTQMLYIAMADRNSRFVFQMRRWGRDGGLVLAITQP